MRTTDPQLLANPKEARRTDRFAQFAVAAAQEAVEQAGDIVADPTRRGVWIGTGVGGIATLEEQIVINHEKGGRRVSPFLVPMMMANSACANVSMRFGWQGPCENTVTACAAGTHAIGNGARLIMDNRCDVVMAGGTEAAMTPTSIAGFTNMTAMSRRRVAPVRSRHAASSLRAAVLDSKEDTRSQIPSTARSVRHRPPTPSHHCSSRWRGAIHCIELALADVGLSPATSCTSRTARRRRQRRRRSRNVQSVRRGTHLVDQGRHRHALGGAGAIEAARCCRRAASFRRLRATERRSRDAAAQPRGANPARTPRASSNSLASAATTARSSRAPLRPSASHRHSFATVVWGVLNRVCRQGAT